MGFPYTSLSVEVSQLRHRALHLKRLLLKSSEVWVAPQE